MLHHPNCLTYQSSLRDDSNNDSFEVDIDFTLIKTVDCKNNKLKNIYVNKLNRLKRENFNRIKIPKFSYSVDENIVSCLVDFIKGTYVYTPAQRTLIYEDVVCHQSDWTFSDYRDANFILQEGTGDIFSVDFQSYRFYPNKEKRKVAWFNHVESLRWLRQNL